MTITKYAIEQFLSAPKEDFQWMKDLRHADLDELLNGLTPRPHFDNLPMDLHQKVGFMLGISNRSFYLQYGIGAGKSRIALELIKYRIEAGEVKCGLVIVPTDTVAKSWRDEITKWMPQVPMLILTDMDTKERWAAVEAFETGIVVLTFMAWLWMVSSLEQLPKKKKKELVLMRPLLKAMGRKFQAFVVDEATKISSRGSLIFIGLRNIAKMIEFRLLLAGRPFGRDPVDLWSQYYVVDLGKTLGETLGLFREAFYEEKDKFDPNERGWWRKNRKMQYAKTYTFKEKMAGELSRFLNNRALYYDTKECVDLPPLLIVPRYCDLPKVQSNYYDAMVERKWKEGGHENTFLRMRQLSSGYLGIKDSAGEKAEIIFDENPKLDLLLDTLDELPAGKQMLICVEFTVSGQIIHDALTKLRIPHGWVWGGTKNYDEIKHTFDTTPGYHIIGNWKKMGIGTNWQAGNYVGMYEPPTSPIDYEQFWGRCCRKGSLEMGHANVTLFNFIVRGTKDQQILDSIAQGDDLANRILKAPRVLYEASDTKDAQSRVVSRLRPLAPRDAGERTSRPDAPRDQERQLDGARPRVQRSHRSRI